MIRWFIPGLLLALASVAHAQFGPAPVAVSPIVVKEVSSGQSFVGSVKPLRKSLIGSAVDGRVETFFVNEGDYVKKGQQLAKLRSKTLELERDAAEKQAEMYQQEFLEAKNGARKQEREESKAMLAAAEAKLNYSKAKYQRTRKLIADRTATQEEMQESESLFEQASQEMLRARAMNELVLEGPRPERIAMAKARFESQDDLVTRFNDQIALHIVRAPFDGYISVEHTEEGYWVMRGGPIVEMVELEKVDVEIQVQEDAIPYLLIGTDARIELPAIPGRTFMGKVASIVPQANERSRTFPVKIRVDNVIENNQPLIKAGMFARGTLPVGKRETAMMVSKDAIVLGGPVPIVYAVGVDPMDMAKQVAKLVPVQLGIAEGGLVQVKGPLQPTDKVVVQGNERLRPGQSIMVTKELPPGTEPEKSVLDRTPDKQ